MDNPNDHIPPQTEGEKTDAIHFKDMPSVQEAHHLFLLAKDRLRDVSQWHNFSGTFSARFGITDSKGDEVYKMAEKGDIFYINLPAPGPMAGDGKEWVRIEEIVIEEGEETENEYIAITVRPIASPMHPDKATAHFFGHASTNTFIVERYKNHVSAAVHGRNETPNTTDTNIYDRIRNTIIALTAREGLSLPQWKSFVSGILEK
ncbi:hypothetical protein FFF34_013540 [Inquilinus sp. KBS0705]|nr:hypothetical protein FFF34_013540 [Inquilinus sp. KBS0705]